MVYVKCTLPGSMKGKLIIDLMVHAVSAHNVYQDRNQGKHWSIVAKHITDNVLNKMKYKGRDTHGNRVKQTFPVLKGTKLKNTIKELVEKYEAEFDGFEPEQLAAAIDGSTDCDRNRELSIIISQRDAPSASKKQKEEATK